MAEHERAETQAWACGKAILLGEHAVVYERPAIAVPVSDRRVMVSVQDAPAGDGITIIACDLDTRYLVGTHCVDEHGPFMQAAVEGALAQLCSDGCWPDLEITVRSNIPIARGMGSGAAVSAAIARGIADHLGVELPCERLSEMVFDTECLLHGTPSGIDNTVVAFEMPVWFQQGRGAEPFDVGKPLTLLIGDTGIPSRTHESVALVRQRWQEAPETYERLFDAVGAVVEAARDAIGAGDCADLGRLMNRNQALLTELGVSDPALERLIAAARAAGALGAKLSGGGMGGCMIALVAPEGIGAVDRALRQAGACDIIQTQVGISQIESDDTSE